MTERRTPTPPPEVAEWMLRWGGAAEEDDADDAGVPAAIRALRHALARPGRDREGAYSLLASDALLTYAAEDAADAEDPGAVLRSVIEAVVGELP